MELDMPITRVLLNSGPSGLLDSKSAKLTVQPAQVLSKLPLQLDMSPTKSTGDGSPSVGKMCDSNKYKMSIARRNERERRRVQNVNRTFDTLRHHVQGYRNANKKMSKVETLRCAVEYIRELRTILGLFEDDDGGTTCDIDNDPYDHPAGIPAKHSDYQMPITPSSPIHASQTSSFEYPAEPLPASPGSASSPMPPSPPASTPPVAAGDIVRSSCSVPTSPLSPAHNTLGGSTILANRLRMPLNAGCSEEQPVVVVKPEPFECVTPDMSTGVSFDFNANSTMPVVASNAFCGEDQVLDDQSYSRLAAALQAHAGQPLGQLNFGEFQYAL